MWMANKNILDNVKKSLREKLESVIDKDIFAQILIGFGISIFKVVYISLRRFTCNNNNYQ